MKKNWGILLFVALAINAIQASPYAISAWLFDKYHVIVVLFVMSVSAWTTLVFVRTARMLFSGEFLGFAESKGKEKIPLGMSIVYYTFAAGQWILLFMIIRDLGPVFAVALMFLSSAADLWIAQFWMQCPKHKTTDLKILLSVTGMGSLALALVGRATFGSDGLGRLVSDIHVVGEPAFGAAAFFCMARINAALKTKLTDREEAERCGHRVVNADALYLWEFFAVSVVAGGAVYFLGLWNVCLDLVTPFIANPQTWTHVQWLLLLLGPVNTGLMMVAGTIVNNLLGQQVYATIGQTKPFLTAVMQVLSGKLVLKPGDWLDLLAAGAMALAGSWMLATTNNDRKAE